MVRLLICTAALAAASHSSGVTELRAADAPEWHTDYTKGKALAKQLKRPLFVVFR